MSDSSTTEKHSLLLHRPGVGFEHERTIWRNRGLLSQLVRADLRSRYVATSMGFFWSVIHPFLLLMVYILVFSFIFAAKWEDRGFTFTGNYAVYLCCGLLPWTWFNEAVNGAASSILAQGTLLRKNVFPSVILPFQAVVSSMIHFLIAFSLFLIYRLAVHGFPGWGILFLPGLILLQVAFIMGPALLVATLNVFWRDVSQILLSGMMILFWLTPIIYNPDMFRDDLVRHFGEVGYERLLWFFWLNPVYHLVSLYQRMFFFDSRPEFAPEPWVSVLYLVVLSLVVWFLARRLYARARPRMVEMV